MTVTVAGQSFPCTRAVKDGNAATLYLSDGGMAEFRGIHDWDAFALEGGEWESALPSEADRLAALEAAVLAVMMGGLSNV